MPISVRADLPRRPINVRADLLRRPKMDRADPWGAGLSELFAQTLPRARRSHRADTAGADPIVLAALFAQIGPRRPSGAYRADCLRTLQVASRRLL